jgi:Mrp family chromosome partitioning ATPase
MESGKMADNAPDLVQRAAARLQQATSKPDKAVGFVPSGETTRPPDLLAARFDPPDPARSADRFVAAAAPQPEQVTVSPTSMAAHGIASPANGQSRTVEEFRALKRHLLSNVGRSGNGTDSSSARVILMTSARPGEGKTFTAVNLALALAYEKDTRVLLMDADAYRQSAMSYLGISAEKGWLDALGGSRAAVNEIVLKTNVPGLSVLPTGKESGEIPEIMSSRPMKDLLGELVREDPARFIIMDALPCLTSTEPSILAALAGQTLFVVAAHQTSREDIESSLRLLNASPGVNLVLNKADALLSEQFKGYGYAYGYPR